MDVVRVKSHGVVQIVDQMRDLETDHARVGGGLRVQGPRPPRPVHGEHVVVVVGQQVAYHVLQEGSWRLFNLVIYLSLSVCG